ncbi:MAG: gamma-glutamyltransferase [Xanthomonadales bacterium]|jgi:gamma-glutamyltranspeptidase/glutathione hydrolase|nr:gamma-glutamyltransferase [Xanthomonadales bacterium]
MRPVRSALAILILMLVTTPILAQDTARPVLLGKHWMAITGKPQGATAGAMMFQQGGNAVDAAAAMLAVTSTMWDVLSWGGETQALIYNPNTKKVIGINALGVAPTGATPAFFREQGMTYPPEYGPLAAVTPGTPGGLMVMVAEYGKLSLAQVLAPAMQMAEGYPIEASQADNIERRRNVIERWPSSIAVFLPHYDPDNPTQRAAPYPGEIFRQPDLLATLQKLVEAEAEALQAGAGRKAAIYAAYERFYRGDIAEAMVGATREAGGLFTRDDLANWEVKLEEPVKTSYRGIDVYKLTTWTQGPVLLQALNLLEGFDLKAMGYNSTRYIHTLYQAMNLAYADRDFYYGDPYFPPEEPVAGLLSKDYAAERRKLMPADRNLTEYLPGDPYAFQRGDNPFEDLRRQWKLVPPAAEGEGVEGFQQAGNLGGTMSFDESFVAGTTAIQAADREGWIVSVTPSGGWIPAFVAGNTGIGLSQRMQSFVVDEALNPYNVVEPGKRPRVTLTPSMAFKDGKPFFSFSIQGGDLQDQNLLQFFLNLVEFDMNVQQAAEAHNIHSFQMQASFGAHEAEPGRLQVTHQVPPFVRAQLEAMGYDVEVVERTYNPSMGIFFDVEEGVMHGGASDYGDDYGIAW